MVISSICHVRKTEQPITDRGKSYSLMVIGYWGEKKLFVIGYWGEKEVIGYWFRALTEWPECTGNLNAENEKVSC